MVDFCFRTLDFNNSLVCNVEQLVTVCNSRWNVQFEKIWSHLTTYLPPPKKLPPPTYLTPTCPRTYLPPPPPPPHLHTPPPQRTYPHPDLPTPPPPPTSPHLPTPRHHHPPALLNWKNVNAFYVILVYYFLLFLVFFWYSDFVQVRVKIILHDDSSRFRYSTGYVF